MPEADESTDGGEPERRPSPNSSWKHQSATLLWKQINAVRYQLELTLQFPETMAMAWRLGTAMDKILARDMEMMRKAMDGFCLQALESETAQQSPPQKKPTPPEWTRTSQQPTFTSKSRYRWNRKISLHVGQLTASAGELFAASAVEVPSDITSVPLK